jgi:hypothetical protein
MENSKNRRNIILKGGLYMTPLYIKKVWWQKKMSNILNLDMTSDKSYK